VAKEQQKNAAPDAAVTPGKPAAAAKRKKEFKKKRERRVIPHGVVYVAASFQQHADSITDTDGRVVCWSSAVRSAQRLAQGPPYAAQQASLAAAGVARDQYGMKSVEVRVKGPGSGRESAVRALAAAGLHIVVIRDVTPIPHNGCRPPKRRRV